MRGKTIIRCAQCHVGSDVRLILVFKNVKKCMSCAAIDGVLREGHHEDKAMIDSNELIKRMEEGAHAVNTGAHEGMPKEKNYQDGYDEFDGDMRKNYVNEKLVDADPGNTRKNNG